MFFGTPRKVDKNPEGKEKVGKNQEEKEKRKEATKAPIMCQGKIPNVPNGKTIDNSQVNYFPLIVQHILNIFQKHIHELKEKKRKKANISTNYQENEINYMHSH